MLDWYEKHYDYERAANQKAQEEEDRLLSLGFMKPGHNYMAFESGRPRHVNGWILVDQKCVVLSGLRAINPPSDACRFTAGLSGWSHLDSVPCNQ